MKKYKIIRKAYFFIGVLGVLLSSFGMWSNYLDGGRCTSGGRVGGPLCGNDNYIFGALVMAISFILISGGIKKR